MVAHLVPAPAVSSDVTRERARAAIARLAELSKGVRLDGLSIRELRDAAHSSDIEPPKG